MDIQNLGCIEAVTSEGNSGTSTMEKPQVKKDQREDTGSTGGDFLLYLSLALCLIFPSPSSSNFFQSLYLTFTIK